jgi:DNA-binding SARP family transcriptional activator
VSTLALQVNHAVSRDELLDVLWPDVDFGPAMQSLHSLVYSLNKALNMSSLVAYSSGYYYLTDEVGVDTTYFDGFAEDGDRRAREGLHEAAARAYGDALDLYRGDLCVSNGVNAIIERERLHARYLTLLARLGQYHFERGRFEDGLDYALALLRADPCREDGHRLAMRCYLKLGERAQAMRQFRICEVLIRDEYAASPEPATIDLYDQIRRAPADVS